MRDVSEVGLGRQRAAKATVLTYYRSLRLDAKGTGNGNLRT